MHSVVVTGGAGDMGRAICESFLADGYLVFAADLKPGPAAERLIPVALDVTDRAACKALALRADTQAPLKVWVNGAGIFATGPVEEADSAVWDRIIAVNLTGTFHGCAAALPILKAKGGGHIVNIGSVSGQVGGVGVNPAYGASKAGVHALTKTYAVEGARFNVTCNAVAPGLLQGSMTGAFSDSQMEKMMKTTPMRRLGRMEEVASAVRFLADRQAGYVTGAILPVNGGVYLYG
jgi:NAD(P)-dependent dehydrogenase (short-subunit alcohol dehydrogenase family)